MASTCGALWRAARRRRVFAPHQLEGGNLKRCLGGWDLAALGVGSTLGVGVYVLVGSVALRLAGPAVVLSFAIAAAASVFAGLCYAEFGARVPRAGSSYIYTYVTIGELLAFFVGWINILESVFGTASVARGLSTYVDAMGGKVMSEWFTTVMPIGVENLAEYFDLCAFLLVVVFGVLLAVGVRESATVNNALTVVNVLVIMFIICAGAANANLANWSIPASAVPAGAGAGGFAPYGVLGVLRGAAVCFYGFVGFDTINASGEEVKNPCRTIPVTILVVLALVFVAYAGVSVVVTMMVPYYLQDTTAAVSAAFSFVGWEWARWVVAVGALFGILSSMMGALFPLPRLVHAMAADGLLWRALAAGPQSEPRLAALLPAAITAVLAGIFSLDQLVTMMCIGTLLSYAVVAVCVIILRYRPTDSVQGLSTIKTRNTYFIVMMILILFITACLSSALVWRLAETVTVPLSVINVVAAILVIIMSLQPKVKADLAFKAPLVPIIPCLCIYFNIHLLVFINVQTWIRVMIWMLIGIPVYITCVFCYKKDKTSNLEENMKTFSHSNKNGKTPIQIVIETPTPPGTTGKPNNTEGNIESKTSNENINDVTNTEENRKSVQPHIEHNDEIVPYVVEEEVKQYSAIYENNEEKEAKIIDLLDQVLQAEEDAFGEIISLKDPDDNGDNVSIKHVVGIWKKSLSELSDAGSDASMAHDVLSKYDVIAQVHREDLPRVTEDNLIADDEPILEKNHETGEYELVTAFNDSETTSRTDESGYSDTIDKTVLNDSTEDVKDVPFIPTPPPLDENFFAFSNFKKSNTVPKKPAKIKVQENEEENKPRESVQSTGSQGDNNLVFGTDRQINFLSKLNNIFQNKITNNEEEENHRKRSNSTGNVVENTPMEVNRDRAALFADLKKEIKLREASPNLRPVNQRDENVKYQTENNDDDDENDEGMSREALKSKLESIFANGPLMKPRLMKSNPPTPEEVYQTEAESSSTESIPKPPKMEKNDTLKRQKDKFSEVMNSLRLSLNKDDKV